MIALRQTAQIWTYNDCSAWPGAFKCPCKLPVISKDPSTKPLNGLAVKASALQAGDPGIAPCFLCWESHQTSTLVIQCCHLLGVTPDFNTGHPVLSHRSILTSHYVALSLTLWRQASSRVATAEPYFWQWCVTCLLVGCLTSQQQASVSQGRICSDNFTCCHTETDVADQTFYLTQSQYTDTGPISPSADPITPGAWQGTHWSVNF